MNPFAKSIAVGAFYKAALQYQRKYKRGGYQKLQKIIGKSLIYKSSDNKSWIWANGKIISMSIQRLEKLTEKIKNTK